MTKSRTGILWLVVVSPFLVLFILINLTSLGFFGSLPTFDQLESPKNNLATEIISEDGMVLGKYFFENRSRVKYNEIPETLINALISTEDVRFRQHSGIDARALLRAIAGALIGKKSSGGASTITQQLSKMLFTENPSSGRERVMQKLKEWIIAAQLERRYTKDEILTMYLNRFDWVNNAVGIKSAAQVYFNKKPNSLNIEESAMLVGMLKNPALYNPNRRIELTKSRRDIVLYQMRKYEMISDSLYDILTEKPILLDFKKASHNEGLAPYFREHLRGELKKWCANHTKPDGGKYNLYTDGLKVYTTINSRLQQFAEEGMRTHISSLQKDFYKHWRGYTNAPYPKEFNDSLINTIIDQGMRRSERYRRLKKEGKSEREIRKRFKEKVPMTVFSWKGEIDTVLSPRDSIRYNKFFIHSGMMSMDPKTGHVKAYVGGINYRYFKYDHVKIGKRQVGSTFKPFLYSLAIQEGYSPCYEISNVPVIFDKKRWGLEKDWAPKNSGDEFDEMSITLKFGLANSINTVTAYIMKQFGPHAVVDLAKKIGIQSKILAVPSLCLGTFDLSVYEMVGAYSTFVNKGVWTEPIFITKIEDKNGVVLEKFIPKTQEAMSKETADLMVRMLQGVVDGVYSPAAGKTRGTGVRLRFKYGFENEMGGKTGTTQNQSDGYFMGITPNLVTGVWSGCEDRSAHFRDISFGQGANMALPIFAEYMQRVYADTLESGIYPIDFEIPNSIDARLDCGEAIQGKNYEQFEDEF
ncbi:transglycosylase domain-containing protein [Flavobacteriales bacterium]|nr:transglycosylase domain-containing protein [Flavobacteriales bacterium]